MKNLIQYRYSIEDSFFQFIHGKISLSELIIKLKSIEDNHRQITKNFNKEIWFKFGKDDTLSTDINELAKDLEPNNKNFDFTIERLKESYKLMGTELMIYFS
jgi:hypothetical protein